VNVGILSGGAAGQSRFLRPYSACKPMHFKA
jgi:hypothetical protein